MRSSLRERSAFETVSWAKRAGKLNIKVEKMIDFMIIYCWKGESEARQNIGIEECKGVGGGFLFA